ncbi:MAG: tol-pal system protein YbgF [Proteobacteria bacterium]|nr:tol-pal system protein YbgF [Pseudomonadota bacterium]
MGTSLNKILDVGCRMLDSKKQKTSFLSCKLSPFTFHLLFFSIVFTITLSLFGCASTDEITILKSNIISISNDLNQLKGETNTKLFAIAKEQESLRKQLMGVSTSVENRDDKNRTLLGRIEELDHQLQTYWKDTKAEISALKTGNVKPPIIDNPTQTSIIKEIVDPKYETTYKEAFDKFQQGAYEEAAVKFSDFINVYPGTPLISNAYYWLGESYLNLKNYEKAIVNFQEVIDKYPKSDKASRALLSQAEAFGIIKDPKSSKTVLKKVIELYPKTEEAAIAERKLRNLGLR